MTIKLITESVIHLIKGRKQKGESASGGHVNDLPDGIESFVLGSPSI